MMFLDFRILERKEIHITSFQVFSGVSKNVK